MLTTLFTCVALMVAPPATQDWIPLFDGETLGGWSGDLSFWRVEDGAIVGQSTPDHPCTTTTYLHSDNVFGDFELEFQIKLEGSGANSGMQYRSTPRGKDVADGFDLSGYQADLDQSHTYSGILYETYGRGIAVKQGEAIHFAKDNSQATLTPTSTANLMAPVKATTNWHDYRIVAHGPWLQHIIDGVLVAVAKDEAPSAKRHGILALQLHAGAPMTVRVRNLRLRELPAPEAHRRLPAPTKEDIRHALAAKKVPKPTLVGWIVGGHPEIAWKVLREWWPDDRPGLDAFAKSLQNQLDTSESYIMLPWSSVRWSPEG